MSTRTIPTESSDTGSRVRMVLADSVGVGCCAHPTVYVRREIYERYGSYLTDHGSAADYECMLRLMVRHQIRVGYLPQVTVKMRVGGKSSASVKNRIAANRADQLAWMKNGLRPPYFLRFSKPLRKLPQYWRKPR